MRRWSPRPSRRSPVDHGMPHSPSSAACRRGPVAPAPFSPHRLRQILPLLRRPTPAAPMSAAVRRHRAEAPRGRRRRARNHLARPRTSTPGFRVRRTRRLIPLWPASMGWSAFVHHATRRMSAALIAGLARSATDAYLPFRAWDRIGSSRREPSHLRTYLRHEQLARAPTSPFPATSSSAFRRYDEIHETFRSSTLSDRSAIRSI